jgi:hypothetical protein
MTQENHSEDPAVEREDRRDDPYRAVIDRFGLQTPQGPAEAHPEGIVAREPYDRSAGCADPATCAVHGDPVYGDEVGKRVWPYDY